MMQSTMHVQSLGQGRDMVLLHGWAMHAGLFETLADNLAVHYRIHLVDLPGHGMSRDYPAIYDMQHVARDVHAAVNPRLSGQAVWLGWSLGGSVATAIASQVPDSVAALILVASNPCFVKQTDWPCGIDEQLLQSFTNDLLNDYEKTLLRFLSLQIRGAENERELLRQLRNKLRQRPVPVREAVEGGLQILKQFDGRPLLANCKKPVLSIAGEKDTLVPVDAIRQAAMLSPVVTTAIWPATGHAPFLSDPEKFVNQVVSFADEFVS